MIQVALMVEGQSGLNWERWQRMAHAAEELGFVGLYRSDHYTNPNPPDMDSLELWVSLTWLASHTTRIEFGPMVSPVSFRQPTMTARMAAAVDDLSNGRLVLGVGAGWQEREHTNYSWDLLPTSERLDRFEEGLQILTGLLHHQTPLSFAGKYYQLHDAVVLPPPKRGKNLPILIGGNGPERTLPLTARYADEWNGVFITAEKAKTLNARLDGLLEANGRGKSAVRRSLMTRVIFGRHDADLNSLLSSEGRTAEELRAGSIVVGTATAVVDQLGKIAESGMYRVMLQWLDLDDMDRLEALAKSVLPQLRP